MQLNPLGYILHGYLPRYALTHLHTILLRLSRLNSSLALSLYLWAIKVPAKQAPHPEPSRAAA